MVPFNNGKHLSESIGQILFNKHFSPSTLLLVLLSQMALG